MASFDQLSTTQLRHALQLSEQIDKLQQQLGLILEGGSGAARTAAPSASPAPATAGRKPGRKGGKRTMSDEGRARIAAAAKARWAKIKGGSGESDSSPKAAIKSAPKKRGGLTPEGRAKLAAAMKARWADRKKGAPNAPAKK